MGNIDLNLMVSDGMVINILPIQNTIKVEGNVYNPGLIAISKNAISMSKAIELAGGYKPYSLKKRSYVLRSNGQIDKANILEEKLREFTQVIQFLYQLILTHQILILQLL